MIQLGKRQPRDHLKGMQLVLVNNTNICKWLQSIYNVNLVTKTDVTLNCSELFSVIFVVLFQFQLNFSVMYDDGIKGTRCLGSGVLVCGKCLKPFGMKCIWLERCF